MQRSEQEIERIKSLQELVGLGIDPYPAKEFKVDSTARDILDKFDGEKMTVSLAGRIMSRRIMGKASFVELKDSSGRIQLYITRDNISGDGEYYNNVFKRLLDIGDIIWVRGFVFKTKVGEITVNVEELTLVSKSIKPIPIVKTDADGTSHDVFCDTELRYRQRYVDLIVNDNVKDTFIKRVKIIDSIRTFLNERDYIEVETPVLQPIPGGAIARPFITHHNALDIPLYLRISNELYLKRLIVGGFDGVYEFSKDFRNEGMDKKHNPEFTVMELYVAYKDYNWMMNLTEELLEKITFAIHGKTKIQVGKNEIEFSKPYKRISIIDSIEQHTGVNISGMDEKQLHKVCKKLGIQVDENLGKGKIIDEIFGEKCEKNIIQPTFITDYPIEMSPLSKRHRENSDLTERFELIVNGQEIANAYSELNDPIEQEERFKAQLELSKKGDDEAMFIDKDFIRALEYGMPPTAGIGIGIDRLVMMMTNNDSIQEVLFFPQMRPEKS
ncbi:lysine--tRNA ligase [Ichthyobacterium seriolicida]|uniref:Lysine--tRNA ligase n=1 Tax=Ichthyobacterium seriolicida TaxID=242600 RepID=A0A1J1E8P2_9FLAO|nr:lysine--tRNA ligase [Ichthyobacterium seriolicida]BAV94299.1 lysyl-tRNA synthetase [Ichthyobacterium seriolicida]